MIKVKQRHANKLKIAGRGLVVRQLRIDLGRFPFGQFSFRSSLFFGQERAPKSPTYHAANRCIFIKNTKLSITILWNMK